MEEIVKRVISECSADIDYFKIENGAATDIKKELMITKNPVFLLIFKGDIQEVFSGTVGYSKIKIGLKQFIENSNNQGITCTL